MNAESKVLEELFTTAEIAAAMRSCTKTALAKAKEKRLKLRRKGNAYLWTRADFDAVTKPDDVDIKTDKPDEKG